MTVYLPTARSGKSTDPLESETPLLLTPVDVDCIETAAPEIELPDYVVYFLERCLG